jgi:hypothetical protein
MTTRSPRYHDDRSIYAKAMEILHNQERGYEPKSFEQIAELVRDFDPFKHDRSFYRPGLSGFNGPFG